MNEIIKQLNEIAFEANCGAVDRVDGKPKAVVVIANAIAEITRLETELRQAKKQDHTKPMTNRAWLESLSDEEFVCELHNYNECDDCGLVGECDSCLCDKQFVKWLKAEHKEN